MENHSPHHPLHAGSVETFTGTMLVETSLREIQTMSASLVSDPVAGACFVTVQVVEDGSLTKKLLLSVFDSAYAAAVIDATVCWNALGK